MPEANFKTSPVHEIERDVEKPLEGSALCLSGGGYRAMLFHVGALWRLYETRQLATLDRVSSVSGGSIAAAILALAWNDLHVRDPSLPRFVSCVVEPLRKLARRTIDGSAIVLGALLPWSSAGKRLAALYDEVLFRGRTLQDFPDNPRFVINATNVQSGALWRFTKAYMRDYRVGSVPKPTVKAATAVAASSAFPPFLSPVVLDLSPPAAANDGEELGKEPFTTRVVLSDGGVYDNLGLETAFKRHSTILVSDGGAAFGFEPKPREYWGRHTYRVLNVIDNQVRSLRKRLLIEAYKAAPNSPQHRGGAYWGIGSDPQNYGVAPTLTLPAERIRELATVPTRLAGMGPELQERLINWGYGVCDLALRKHVAPALEPASKFPFPARGV